MNTINNLLDVLHQAHQDNAQLEHFAKHPGRLPKTTMPTTSFVYEFFLYNSIYQYDWQSSLDSGQLSHWWTATNSTSANNRQMADGNQPDVCGTCKRPHAKSQKMTDSVQQRNLEKFIRSKCERMPSILRRAFHPIADLTDLDGAWTEIHPDARITAEDGREFFRKLQELVIQLRNTKEGEDLQPSKELFSLIETCRRFVFKIRCNIFHGSKTLGEIWEPKQRRRLAIYDLFLKCLVSLFFLSVDRNPVASDLIRDRGVPKRPRQGQTTATSDRVVFPLTIDLGNQNVVKLDGRLAANLRARKCFKPEDSHLVQRLLGDGLLVPSPLSERSALFYPSAGNDIITPTLIGICSCRQFYYFDERSYGLRAKGIQTRLKDAIGVEVEIEDHGKDQHFHFDVGGYHRVIHCLRADNREFLTRDVDLTFFFHRGDSEGEGGSGQEWDSTLFRELMSKIRSEDGCLFIVTDGAPGGLHDELKTRLKLFKPPTTEPDRGYYYGKLLIHDIRNSI